MKKRITAIIITLVLLIAAIPVQVFAVENGNSAASAIPIELNTRYYKIWNVSNRGKDYYVKFTLPTDGYITIAYDRPIDDFGETSGFAFEIYKDTGVLCWESNTSYCNIISSTLDMSLGLPAGSYYLKTRALFYVSTGTIGTYYSVNFTSSDIHEKEFNGTIPTATEIDFFKTYYGFSGGSVFDEDYFKIYSAENNIARVYLPSYADQKGLSDQSTFFFFTDAEGHEDNYFDIGGQYNSDGVFYVDLELKEGYNYILIKGCKKQIHYGLRIDIMHDCQWDDGEIIQNPTAVMSGLAIYTCTICGGKKTEEIPTSAVVAITEQPQSIAAAYGEIAKITVEATGNGLDYKWYCKNAGEFEFVLISSLEGNTYSVDTNETYEGSQVYCVITDQYGNSLQTDIATISVKRYAKIVTQPKSISSKPGKTAKVSIKAEGDDLTYQWYIKNAGSRKFSKSSVTTPNYSTKMSAKADGRQIYCVIIDRYGNSVKSDTVTLSMDESIKIITQPKSIAVDGGKTAKVKVESTGEGLTYQWYIKNAGKSGFSKSSVKNATYSAKMSSKVDGRQAYCVITDKYGNSVKTDTITLFLNEGFKIINQPKNVTVTNGKTTKVEIEVIGEGLTYRWYIKNEGKSKFSKSSVSTDVYSVKMSSKVDGRQIYCVITDKYGNSVKTNTITLNLK